MFVTVGVIRHSLLDRTVGLLRRRHNERSHSIRERHPIRDILSCLLRRPPLAGGSRPDNDSAKSSDELLRPEDVAPAPVVAACRVTSMGG